MAAAYQVQPRRLPRAATAGGGGECLLSPVADTTFHYALVGNEDLQSLHLPYACFLLTS
jgi:hypothetical protein